MTKVPVSATFGSCRAMSDTAFRCLAMESNEMSWPAMAKAKKELLPGGAQAGYIYQNVINPGDPTFNQELGINNAGTIAGYFGSGAPIGTPPPFTLTPTQGYTVE